MLVFFSPTSSPSLALKKAALSASLLMFCFMVQAESANTSPESNTQNAEFSHWSQHAQASNTIIPPPPPGPYQSSALKNYSMNVPVYSHTRPPAMPIDMFSPDIPWPTNLRPEQAMTNHHVSNQNQHHVPPAQVMPSARSSATPKPPVYSQYGYTRRQNVSPAGIGPSGMDSNSSRWIPSMNMAPPGPYNSRAFSNSLSNNRRNFTPYYSPNSNNTPGYGMTYGPSYARPMMNNTGSNSAYPAYR